MNPNAKMNPLMVTDLGNEAFEAIRSVARSHRLDVHKTTLRFCLERFIHRVFSGREAARFTLKGGMIMMLAEGSGSQLRARATSDVDIQVPAFDGTQAEFEAIMRDALAEVPSTDDGVRFDVGDMRVEAVRELVPGCSISIPAYVGRSKIRIKADVTFDDRSLVTELVADEIPSLLPGLPPVHVTRVPFEHVVADKLQALVRHGPVNYRMRDYYDLYAILTRGKAPDTESVVEAMRRTFALFDTPIPTDVAEVQALSEANAQSRVGAWAKECGAKGFHLDTPPFPEMVGTIRLHLGPMILAAQPGAIPAA